MVTVIFLLPEKLLAIEALSMLLMLKSLVEIAGEPSDHFGGDSPGEVIA